LPGSYDLSMWQMSSKAGQYVQGLWQQLQQRESELRGPGVRIPAVLAALADHMGEGISNLQHALSHVLADAKHAALVRYVGKLPAASQRRLAPLDAIYPPFDDASDTRLCLANVTRRQIQQYVNLDRFSRTFLFLPGARATPDEWREMLAAYAGAPSPSFQPLAGLPIMPTRRVSARRRAVDVFGDAALSSNQQGHHYALLRHAPMCATIAAEIKFAHPFNVAVREHAAVLGNVPAILALPAQQQAAESQRIHPDLVWSLARVLLYKDW